MSRMKILYVLFAILVLTPAAAAQDDLSSIKNFLRVNKDFCTGGQPKLEHLRQLKAEGVKAIINLRQPSEYEAGEEEAKAKALGFRYFNIPVAAADPKDEQATEFLKLTDDPANRPAFIHCRSAARAGAFWMIRRVLRDGWTIEDAELEAQKIGLRDHPALSEFARKYIQNHRNTAALPSSPLTFGAFTARFDPSGTFTLESDEWPKLTGNWKNEGAEIVLVVGAIPNGPGGCDGPGKYRVTVDGKRVLLALVADECKVRQLMIDQSAWFPAGEAKPKAVRTFVRTASARPPSASTKATGSWPSFRGPNASGIAEGQ